ncbi:reverse transcriptase domain-containing protein [Tanacetum coccineum]
MVQTRQPNNPPDVVEIIAQQLQNIIPNIVTQVTNNLNNGNGNGNGGGNNGCTYKGFVACGPRDFDGTGGAVALTRWIEKMESVIDNSGCLANQTVKYTASSFIGKALTWWNTQVQARGRDDANEMAWNDFKALLTTEFCPSNEIKKLEGEFRNHSMVGADHAGYTDRFHELAKLVPYLVTPEAKHVTSGTLAKAGKKRKEKDEASKLESVGKDVKKAKGGRGFVAAVPLRRENGNFPKCARYIPGDKRKLDNNNQAQQQSPKRQNVALAYAAGTGERNEYAGTLLLCNRCKLHHNGPWHYMSDCPELKNQNHGNQAEGTGARGLVHALGGGEADQDLNDMEDDISA